MLATAVAASELQPHLLALTASGRAREATCYLLYDRFIISLPVFDGSHRLLARRWAQLASAGSAGRRLEALGGPCFEKLQLLRERYSMK